MYEALEALIDTVTHAFLSVSRTLNSWLAIVVIVGLAWFVAFGFVAGPSTNVALAGLAVAVLSAAILVTRILRSNHTPSASG
jgi:hypothetical protein